ncbi:MAG: hypothetical protein HY013_04820 [Candidatus Solibacter usitatus]|nr:hypothetical protein [Candidatus Solibacter usitatus]
MVLAAAAAGLWIGFYQPSTVRSQSTTAEPLLQFRIIVGLTDNEPKSWQGTVQVASGDLVSISGWRFSQTDRVEPGGRFEFRTKIGNLENQLRTSQPLGQTDWGDPAIPRLIPQGLLLRVRGHAGTRVRFDSDAGAFEFGAGDLPLSVLGGNGRVEQVPVEEKISGSGANDYPALAIAPDGTRWIAWLSYRDQADQVMASAGGKIHELTGRGDHHAPALAADGKGRIWAVWSQNDGGVFHLYARVFQGRDWSPPEKLTALPGNNLWPRLASDGQGRLALVWQGFRDNQSAILLREWNGRRWSAEKRLSPPSGNAWTPSAAFGGGKLWIAWDSYSTGSYQIYVGQASGEPVRVTRGENFSVRPSIAVTAAGRPVVAWEESDALWGKDFAFLHDRRGTPLYKNRRIRVAALDGGEWKELPPVAAAAPAEIRRYIQQPELAADTAGRLYLSFRCRVSAATARIDNWANNGRWETFLTRLEESRWTPAIPMPSSVGRNSMRAALAIAGGRVHVAWPADNRPWPAIRYGELAIYAASLPTEGRAARLIGGSALAATPVGVENNHPNEAADTRRMRDYRLRAGGKEYRILRGDLHRHTELSGDGAGDGSLDDLYRYFLDAAQMDYAHVGDHQMGNDEEYNWWITQKSNDLYHMPRRFVPLYGYERSVWWPNGHRNIIWAERGKPVLKIGEAERTGGADSGPILYPQLRETKGIATSHTSATEQGTDWRDNDPELEPLVEIYQGFESSYEHQGAPRAWKPGDKTVHQGSRQAGFVWNAWAKGYKLGVQASSDHVSTHSSYACILVEDYSRQGLLDAMRRRHAYAATDQIVLDYRIETSDAGTALMGDILCSRVTPKLVVKVLGTAAVKQIDVIKNNTYIHKVNPNEKQVALEYVDNSEWSGESYYYVRVEQTDGQLAWSSPIWVKR